MTGKDAFWLVAFIAFVLCLVAKNMEFSDRKAADAMDAHDLTRSVQQGDPGATDRVYNP